MGRRDKIPKFPDSYIGKKAEEYDNLKSMERNQKKNTTKCIQYLFDEKLSKGTDNIQKDGQYLVLDLGCGSGFSLEVLIQQGFRVIGVDVLFDMLSKANEKKKLHRYRNANLILADVNNLPLKNKKIDHIISVSAYNFITYNKDGLGEKRKVINNTAKYLNKILKKNGRIIIEFYPENKKELDLFCNSFITNGFEGFMVKKKPNQKSGQIFLLLKKKR
ncbi:MAG: class I SAM-dependent methyltransferase [Promethearchaeota archaeon]